MQNLVNSSTGFAPHTMALFSANDCLECFITLESTPGLGLDESWDEVMVGYALRMEQLGLSASTEVMFRVHLSDIHNQAGFVHTRLAERATSTFVSLVGQPPASGGKIAMEAYHIQSLLLDKLKMEHGVVVKHAPYLTIWTDCRPAEGYGSFKQTEEMFKNLCRTLVSADSTLAENLVRTWIYVRDVDNNYQGMVDARRELFKRNGLTSSTHYVASTCIEALSEKASHLVRMDGLIVTGLRPEQLVHLHSPEHLCPTYLYDVTFERASRLIFGDRSHYYISGTASIDKDGNVLHQANIIRQAERTLENVNALLEAGGASFDDLKHLVVYLRDASDYPAVKEYLDTTLPDSIPYITVRGAVCRPSWLIEIEGVAVNQCGDGRFAPFCG